MKIITKNENKTLLLIKNNLPKYPNKISYDVIQELLDISETQLMDLLESLEKNGFIKLDQENKEVNYLDLDKETKVVEDKKALKKYILNKTEEEAYNIIQNIIKDHGNYAPRYIIEGSLLYGELELTPKRTYNILVSLENKGLIKKVKKNDGAYYTI